MLLSLGLLNRSTLFHIALTSTACHDIYTLHSIRKLILKISDLILQKLQMDIVSLRVRVTIRHIIHLNTRLLHKLELVLHLLSGHLIMRLVERFWRLIL